MMDTDQFVNAKPMDVPVAACAPTPEVMATGRAMLDTVAKPEFAAIMTRAAEIRTVLMQMQTPFVAVEQEAWGNEVFLIVKGLEDDLDALRKGAKALSNLYNKSVDGALKPTADLLRWCEETIEKPILAWRKQQRDNAALTAATGQATSGQPIEIAPGVMAGAGGGVPGVVCAPLTSGDVAASGGGAVGGRMELRVEIIDKLEFLKAVVSDAERNQDLTVDLVELNEKAVKELWKTSKRRSIPGLNIYEGEKLVGKRKARKAGAGTEAAGTEKK